MVGADLGAGGYVGIERRLFWHGIYTRVSVLVVLWCVEHVVFAGVDWDWIVARLKKRSGYRGAVLMISQLTGREYWVTL
jgi:hypothetical protein